MTCISIIGAGPAGVSAALRAAELSAEVTLISDGEFGGMASNDGPVPVRTLAHVARLMRDARQLPLYGVSVGEPKLDDRFILCTGGVSRKLPIPGFELTATHSDAWKLRAAPPSMIVIGAGATGAQVASIFNAFGTKAQLFQAGPRILPTEDEAVSAEMAAAFRARPYKNGGGSRGKPRAGLCAPADVTRIPKEIGPCSVKRHLSPAGRFWAGPELFLPGHICRNLPLPQATATHASS